jgi:hypothetical protein
MSEQNQQPFRSREQELEHLGRQLGDIKDALREIAGRVNQIERHVKRAFGVSSLPGQEAAKRRKADRSTSETPTISPEQARPIFDELTRTWRDDSPERVEVRLQEMGTPDLKLMAHELGLSFASKPSRKTLISGIIGRVNESIMLSRNTNLTAPRSESESQTPQKPLSEDE